MEFAKAFRVAAFVSLAVAFVLQSNSPTNAQERVSWKMQLEDAESDPFP